MKPKPKFAIEVTRKEFLKLPMVMRRRVLGKHADVILLKHTIDLLAVALAGHGHQWTIEERSSYEEAMGQCDNTKIRWRGRVVELDRHTADEERRLAVATTRRAMRVRTPSRPPTVAASRSRVMGHDRQRTR